MTQPGRTTPFPEGGQVRVLQDLDFQGKKMYQVYGMYTVGPPLPWSGEVP